MIGNERYKINFKNFLLTNPNSFEFVAWNWQHMQDCIASGDAINAGVYATEMTHWLLPDGILFSA